ncbi:hypothetical protein CAPTEDRAFT_160367 [Capitella teleta]|uniref:UDP-N-acetylglucosamine diphosphorylase n=1 Tax=Capitella teleta TaxID=283909 RepID=R7U1N9_CAPTE|nr:hypothetical protein CAPTEDRAFT_160367 [Capitella teleta]|eukprot:ELT97581.1 hypothetical protein CAPTEDRAFT_160367 [Capitella teleta]
MDVEALRADLKACNQEHLVQFWDALTPDQQQALYADLKSINFSEVNTFFNRCIGDLKNIGEKVDSYLQPIPPQATGSVVRTDPEKLKQYEEEGLVQIAEGRVAVLLLAGGQGTRLGVNYPKGMYDCGLPSRKTLYQLQAERILKLQQLAKASHSSGPCVIPWYIMTSEATKEPTRQYFNRHKHFGLQPEQVVFFEQSTLPCMTFEGKVILESPFKVAHAPDGNGGLYRALTKSGVMEDMLARGIKYTHVYCVDNILVKMADPVFMGFCISKGANCGAKVVEKAFPTEPVGVICKFGDHYQVVEYSEITLQTAEKRNSDGRLMFNAGNICNHFFTTEFLKMVCGEREDELRHHIAKKKIPFCNENRETVKPCEPNGIKMEKFVFDVFQFTGDFACWEVLREDEFSPLKNADGAAKDTPTTARHSLYNLHYRHVLKAGGKFIRKDGSGVPHIASRSEDAEDALVVCEISPRLSYAGEGLESAVKGKGFMSPLVLKAPEEDGQEEIHSKQ